MKIHGVRIMNFPRARGITVILVLAFMGIFALLLGTVTSYVLEQGKYGRALYAREQALHVAESGLEYYRWFLAHNPGILTSGTGLVSPDTYAVDDPEGGELGSATITATANMQCGEVQWIDLTSRGVSNANTGFPRTLLARYIRPSVGEYSYLLNSNVWAGADRNIFGPYHSNKGIHMDGTNNSNVTSGVSTWTCNSAAGCSPSQSKPGIFGNGSGSSLWSYPVAPVSFAGMAADFPNLKAKAETYGLMLATTSVQLVGVQQGSAFDPVGNNERKGFHLVFNSDGTVAVYRVNNTSGAQSIHSDDLTRWQNDYHTITDETLVGTYTAPSGCSVIYSEAKTWIEGTVSGKIIVVAADDGDFSPDIILNGNINYAATDGTTGLTAIAEHSVLIPLVVPDEMSIRGIYVAQTGYFGRNLYDCTYSPYDVRTSLTQNGTIVSNLSTGTQWLYGWCGEISGFLTRTDSYDRLLAFSPSPFTPTATSTYRLVLWREE
ncbi:hypothetical protein A3F27_01655 [Candidatus Kaiserbacteria bacterium RIFCSPHIGHO2_12_FULL_53_13]|uniref:Type 4 fimbrial biogenesis protein PilX N-terminal domain-containing protein n=1 Tax=Candidatus Kaiserbacteria bacterium RIFCSPHIGHO2_12_FULL_53_13 TaxID=1798502 RepID=A0A1F6EC11_9BACT|nr:MAG: hypothetical protein A3F27_01655 [Candidatus Kaiserbacteria bacterium RIFCSPHIGHO2_12_FULL_53_13]OGG74498.1 MAG: hypothetical protein A3A37_02675 [Candidatus Kaiserbacteria bacterium RIFCSPLOWO2_01_FULL_52_36]